jgi:chromosome segregation ATPase
LANAAEVAGSLGFSATAENIPESQLRPLAPLTDAERRAVWSAATEKAEESGRSLTAKLVQEAVDRMQSEKEEWRQQAIGEKKARTLAEQKTETAQAEAATLRRTLALEAEKLAAAKVLEARAEIRQAKDQAAQLKDTIKSLKREREDAVSRGVANKLREQQSTLDAKEAQLVSLEQRIAFLKNELAPLTDDNQAVARHRPRIVEVDHLINAIAVLIGDAFDPSYGAIPPDDICAEWDRGAKKIVQLSDMIGVALSGGLRNG